MDKVLKADLGELRSTLQASIRLVDRISANVGRLSTPPATRPAQKPPRSSKPKPR